MGGVLSAILTLLSAMVGVLSAMSILISSSIHFIGVYVHPFKSQFFGGLIWY